VSPSSPLSGFSRLRFAAASSAIALLVGCLAASPCFASGLNLSWNDCGTFGAPTQVFGCNVNTGAGFTLVGSFVPPPGVNELIGMNAEILVMADAPSLPDWWRHGVGECRGNIALSTSFDFTNGPFDCQDFWAGQASGGFAYEIGYVGPRTARITIQCGVPSNLRGPVDSVTECYAFVVRFARTRSTGTGSCSGLRSAPAPAARRGRLRSHSHNRLGPRRSVLAV